MPKNLFQLSIDAWLEIHELPDSWPPDRLREVLVLADFDDQVNDAEALDMTLMALQDLEARDASDVVLQVVCGEAMRSGVRQNLLDDLEDDRPWEQFASVELQSRIFTAVVLLQQAFPTRYGIPDAVRLRFTARPTDTETRQWLDAGTSPALLARLLASGMEDDAVLKRVYGEELAGTRFPSASAVLWRIDPVAAPADGSRTYDIYSSWQWLGPLEDRAAWSGSGWPDEPEFDRSP